FRSRRLAKKNGKRSASMRVSAQPSSDEFDGIVPDRSVGQPKLPVAHTALLIPVFFVAFLVATTLLTVPLVTVTIEGPFLIQASSSSRTQLEEKMKLRDAGRQFRLPVDPKISKIRAGQAYYTVGMAGPWHTEKRPYEHPVPRKIEFDWIP